ncbi:glycosyltransferase family 2 protein [Streptomyces palmae]|uniref:Glycosyltransferase family 2 protein n=1 Tax=Streptomyces palmae TaxID=1701085 RepID=A0A4Z0GIC7_9ACTN|nr:glycosyltransferase family A protein [Streptomyces palmae]TGA96563.1 glycosyltransferase family 2 protein [Streptomyces palmae]
MSVKRAPAVSVVIPCYNYGRYLPQTLDSVLGQTFADWEIVIVDDGSTDDSPDVAQAFIDRHPDRRVRLLRRANAGVSAARNAGISAADGRYILPLDADDVIAPTMLEKTAGLLDAEPGIAIASTDLFVFTDAEDVPPQVLTLPPYSRELLLQRLIMFYCSLYRREVWTAVGGYDEGMRAGEDWDFWIGCAERGFTAHHIAEPLFGARNKDTGLHVAAAENDLVVRARIVANHPTQFKPVTRAWAQALLEQEEDAQRGDARVPDDILSRAGEMDEFLRVVMDLQRIARRQHYRVQHLEQALAERTLPTQGGPGPRSLAVTDVGAECDPTGQGADRQPASSRATS